MRRVLAGLALSTTLLGLAGSAQAVAAPTDEAPLTPHLQTPLNGLLTGRGTPVDWSVLDIGL
ncbi:hypothetical protein QOM21_05145 [Streptomyces sp. Pv4-95]|uniref:hypothetical protein n=1 Tax=Streptomyces sp. Pv4-95 TaxID=3049543 RepID=UPI0038921BF5